MGKLFVRSTVLAAVLAAPLGWAGDCIDFKNAASAAVTIDAFDTASKSGRKGITIKPGYTTTCVCGPTPCTVKVKGGPSLDTPGKGLVTYQGGKLTRS